MENLHSEPSEFSEMQKERPRTNAELEAYWLEATKGALLSGIEISSKQDAEDRLADWDAYIRDNHDYLTSQGIAIDDRQQEIDRFEKLAWVQLYFRGTEYDCGPVTGEPNAKTLENLEHIELYGYFEGEEISDEELTKKRE